MISSIQTVSSLSPEVSISNSDLLNLQTEGQVETSDTPHWDIPLPSTSLTFSRRFQQQGMQLLLSSFVLPPQRLLSFHCLEAQLRVTASEEESKLLKAQRASVLRSTLNAGLKVQPQPLHEQYTFSLRSRHHQTLSRAMLLYRLLNDPKRQLELNEKGLHIHFYTLLLALRRLNFNRLQTAALDRLELIFRFTYSNQHPFINLWSSHYETE